MFHQVLLFSPIVALLGAIVKSLYNIYLHPLKNHPGPKLWAASRLPWCWHQYHGRLNHRLIELHNQYGPVVRVAPNDISYTSETAWKTIYGQRSVEMAKDPIFSLVTPTGVPNIMTADRINHSRHRRLLSYAFSEKALCEQEGILIKYCTKLLDRLEALSEDGPVDLVKWFHLTTFDLIGSLAFGADFSCVDTGEPHPFVTSIKDVSKQLIMSQMANYYGIQWLRNLMDWRGSANSRLANARHAKEMVDARVARGPTEDRKDFWHYILGADESEGKKGLSPAEMIVDAFSIAIAGSDGSATALTASIYLLLTHQDVYLQLQDLIRDSFDAEYEITNASLAGNRIPLLDAVLDETMRLYPPVAITLPRVVPPGGEVIDGRLVPGGTTVGVNHLATYHSEKNFHRAREFVPQRWLVDHDEVEQVNLTRPDTKGAFQPFSVGPRSCLGKNLARAEMRMILARLLWRFDINLMDDDKNWINEQRIYGFWEKPPLKCKLVVRDQR